MVAGPGKVGLAADSWLGWDEESAYGTVAAPSSTSEFAYFTTESMQGDVNIAAVDNITQAHRDVTQTYIGTETCSGDVTLAYVYEGLENLLLHAFGALNNAGGGTSGTFVRDFDLSDSGRYRNATSPSLSIHICRGIVGSGVTNPGIFTYRSCVVDGFTLQCSRGNPLLLTLSFFGQTEIFAAQSIGSGPSFPAAPVATFKECAVTWGGVEIPMEDFTLDVRRNIDRDRFFLGDQFSSEPPMGQYEVTVSGTTEWDNEVRASSQTLRFDYRNRNARALLFSFTSTDDITGTSQKYEANFNLPSALISSLEPNVTERGRVKANINWTGYDDTTTADITELRLSQVAENSFSD